MSHRIDPGTIARGTVAMADREHESPDNANRRMVIQVQERHLGRTLLLEDHPQRIEPVKEFR